MSRFNSYLTQNTNIVYVIDTATIGGTEKYLHDLSIKLSKHCNITIICPEHKELDSWAAKFTKFNIKVTRKQIKSILDFKNLIGFVKIFRSADIVHFVLPCPANSRLAMICSKIANVDIRICTNQLITAPDSNTRIRNLFTKFSVKYAYSVLHKIITVSQNSKQQLINWFNIKEDKIEVVHNSVEIPVVSENNGVNKSNKYDIALIGRLHPQKGHKYLIEAAPKIIKNKPDCHFIFYGDGPDKSFLKSLISDKNLDNFFSFKGHCDNIQNVIKDIDLLVLPSLFEGFPFVILEAMAAAKPVVATAIGGNNECVVEGVTGKLVPAMNSDKLAEAIIHMMHNKHKATLIGLNGWERVNKYFNLDLMVEKTVMLYANLK